MFQYIMMIPVHDSTNDPAHAVLPLYKDSLTHKTLHETHPKHKRRQSEAMEFAKNNYLTHK